MRILDDGRWVKWGVGVLVATWCSAAHGAWGWNDLGVKKYQLWSLQFQSIYHTVPAGQVVYDNDPQRVAAMVAQGGLEKRGLHVLANDPKEPGKAMIVGYYPPFLAWERNHQNDCIVFLQGVKDSYFEIPKIVRIGVLLLGDQRGVSLTLRSEQVRSWDKIDEEKPIIPGGECIDIETLPGQRLRILSGQVDKKNLSLIRIPFEIDGKADEIVLEVRGGGPQVIRAPQTQPAGNRG